MPVLYRLMLQEDHLKEYAELAFLGKLCAYFMLTMS